jgi:hypothetical protein
MPLMGRRSQRLALAAALALLLPTFAAQRAASQAAQSASAVPPDLGPNQTFTGVPWTGPPGITETVADIMRRQAAAPRGDTLVPRERRPEQAGNERDSKNDNPAAFAVPVWPAAGAATRSLAPSVGFTLNANWLGTRLSESMSLPPDSNGAVGLTQVMAISNGRFKLYNKTGTLQGLNIDDEIFFALVSGGFGISDPHVRYDRLSGRWFITEINVKPTSNKILIAVSSGPTITNEASFTFFEFNHDAVGPTPNMDTGHFADYDTLGVDANALYIGVNEFVNGTGGGFQNTSAYVVNKADLLSGTLTVTAFRGLAVGTGAGLYTPQGVDNDDPAATEGYFIGVDNFMFSQLDIRRVTNPGGTPAISGNLTVTVPSTFVPIPQVAQGSTAALDALDDRLFAAMIKRNKLTGVASLWTAHNIRVSSGGVGTSAGDRNASRWYQIDDLTGTPTLTQAGTVFDGANPSPLGFWIPSVAANGQGHMALGASVAGSNMPASANVQSRLSSDAAGMTPQTPHTVLGVAGYNRQPTPPQRWGDYSQVVVDPEDDQTLWTFQEYADAANSWGVRVMKLIAPPPATPTSASPPSVPQGAASTAVTIAGTSISGSGFFDPGAGFPSRIAATVSGVVVNSVTFVNATTVILNISTVGAAAGAKDVTIVNPDTQGRGATSLLTVLSPFTDDPLTPGVTPIKAVHVSELRSLIDQQRVRFGLSPFAWTDATLAAGTTPVRAVHVAELRTALTEAYTAAGRTAPAFSDPVLTTGVTPVRAVHISEIRTALLAIE